MQHEITTLDIRRFLKERPLLTINGLETAAGIPQAYLHRLVRSENPKISELNQDRLRPVLALYGFDFKSTPPEYFQ